MVGTSGNLRTTDLQRRDNHIILASAVTVSLPEIIDLSNYKRPSLAESVSLFRYPGGKAFLSGFLTNEIQERFKELKPTFVEPFCGGAGAALNLLKNNVVSNVILNDADLRIYSAWKAIAQESQRFQERISTVPVDIGEWNRCIEVIYNSTASSYCFELGFATFMVNRMSRSGVIFGSGPIGGYNQTGKYKIDARFNRLSLIKKVSDICEMRDNINFSNDDAIGFCKRIAHTEDLDRIFFFVDPPYVGAGDRLYSNTMNMAKHILLADWLHLPEVRHWVLTYDDNPLVRENYATMQGYHLAVNYSLQKKRLEKELLYKS